MGQVSQRRHPHADAQYRVYKLDDGTFGIEVSIPDTPPTKVTSFPTRKAANQWVAYHKHTVDRLGGSVSHFTYPRRWN